MEDGWRRFTRDSLVGLLAALIAAWVVAVVHADLPTVLAAGIGACLFVLAVLEGRGLVKRRRELGNSVHTPELPPAPTTPSVTYDGIKLDLVDEPTWELWRGWAWLADIQVKITNTNTNPGRVIKLTRFDLESDPGPSWAERPRPSPDQVTDIFNEILNRTPLNPPADLAPGETRVFRKVGHVALPYPAREGHPYCELVLQDAEGNSYPLPVTAQDSDTDHLPALMRLRNLAMQARPLREQIGGHHEDGSAPSDDDRRLRYEDWTNRAGRALKPWPDLQAQFQADRTAASDRDPARFVQRTGLLEEMLRTLEGRPRRDAERPRLHVPEAVQPPPVRLSMVPEADGNRLRLLVRNRVTRGMFKAEVTGVLGPDGRPAPGRQSWAIPWLDDGSVSPADLSQAEGRTLDFAWFEADEGQWPNRASWRFPSLPEPAIVMYRPVHDKKELAGQRFLVTVRIIRVEPSPGHMDRQLAIGVTENGGLVCAEPG